jgi:hypothetical protein
LGTDAADRCRTAGAVAAAHTRRLARVLHGIRAEGLRMAIAIDRCEELGWDDAGLAISLGVSGFHKLFAQMSADRARCAFRWTG